MPRSKPPQPRGASSARTLAPARSRGRSSIQAILRFLGRGLRAFAARAIVLWIWVIDAAIWCFLWILKNPWRSTKTAVSVFFRVATLLSVGYLVYDRIYETGATISSPVSDPNDPLRIPFVITNNSHLFWIRNLSWSCTANHVDSERSTNININHMIRGSERTLPPGQLSNIDCNVLGPSSHFVRLSERLLHGTVEIGLQYDADIFGFYLWHRELPTTRFSWSPGTTYSQWMRGEFAQ
jgi:hypothetical protein